MLNDRGIQTYIDVTVTHPLAPSHIRVHPTQLQMTEAAEQRKMKQYQEFAAKERAEFLPFAVETLGGFGKCAMRLVDQITESGMQASALSTSIYTPQEIRAGLLGAVAIAVQRGNSRIMAEGHRKLMNQVARSR